MKEEVKDGKNANTGNVLSFNVKDITETTHTKKALIERH